MIGRLFRKVLARLISAGGTLGLGFGRTQGQPIEPIERSETPLEPPHGRELHDQQHVDPGRRIEIDKSTE